MALVNISELAIREKLDEILQTVDCCKCEKCYMDILAIALNYVKPRYVNTHEGELIKRVEAMAIQNSVDINIAIVKALELVSHVPHHARLGE